MLTSGSFILPNDVALKSILGTNGVTNENEKEALDEMVVANSFSIRTVKGYPEPTDTWHHRS